MVVVNLLKIIYIFVCYSGLFHDSTFSLDLRCYCNLPSCIQTGYMCRSSLGCFTQSPPPKLGHPDQSKLGQQEQHHQSTNVENHGCLEMSLFVCSRSRDDPNFVNPGQQLHSDESESPPINQTESGSASVNQNKSGSPSSASANQSRSKGQKSTRRQQPIFTHLQCCFDDMCNYPIDFTDPTKIKLFSASKKLTAAVDRQVDDHQSHSKKACVTTTAPPINLLEWSLALLSLVGMVGVLVSSCVVYWSVSRLHHRVTVLMALMTHPALAMTHPNTAPPMMMNHHKNINRNSQGIAAARRIFQRIPLKDNVYVASPFQVDSKSDAKMMDWSFRNQVDKVHPV